MLKLNLLILLLVVFSLFFVSSAVAQQKDSMEDKSMDSKIESAKIQYDLAYPGILPDNPLYKLRVLRDKLSVFFISDPLKRVDFYLLQADKGILATAILIDKNSIKLAGETALKAENNMTLITYELKRLSEKPNDQLFQRLTTASKKHQEVLKTLTERIPTEDQKTLIAVINFSRTNLQTIEKLHAKKYYNKQ